MASLHVELTDRLVAAFAAVAGDEVDPVLRRSQHADFQADASLALAKKLGKAPRDIAAEVVAKAQLDDICTDVEISGPGFINMSLDAGFLNRCVAAAVGDSRLGVAAAGKPQHVVVDYSAPNVAKEMHVGHLRSTFIGDAAVRVLGWMGHRISRENHIGDWGTPFGMLIEHLLDLGETEGAKELSVGDLDAFYKAARVKFDADEAFAERARERVVLLQGGDAETLRLWQILINESQAYFMDVYGRLDVKLTSDDFVGESFYNDQLESVCNELAALGLLVESDGAEVVFPDGFTNRDGNPLPLIVRNRLGGYGYASTDLATIRHRLRDLDAARVVYVVGLPQKLHFQMIFQAAVEAGWLTDDARVEHIGFGSILGTDGKLLRSRSGDSIKLVELIDEAVRRASEAVAEKNPELDAETAAAVAQMVGIGAVKYADLSSERTKDYTFDFDRMLAFEGNTAPYLQYAHARICSIFRKGEVGVPADPSVVRVEADAERALVLELLAFPEVVADVADGLDFHRLAHYLFGVASVFTTFYEHCPVLKTDDATRDSRLVLCELTRRTLAQGLDLLGIGAPEQM
ncbi:MAG: arginine--tRNA ligase [Actinomycetota bacterium]